MVVRKLVTWGLWLIGIGLLSLNLVALMGFAFWRADMLTPFRGQFLLADLAFVILCGALRHKGLMGFAVLTLALNVTPMTIRLVERKLLPPENASLAVHKLSVVMSNVLCDNRQFDSVTRLVAQEHPDVFVAIETTPEWITHLDSLKAAYPYHFAPKGLDILGLTVYARQPFTARLLEVGPGHLPLVRAEFVDFVLYVAHPMPPASKRLSVSNRTYIAEMAKLAGHETKPTIIAGDLNATLWSRSVGPLIKSGWQWPNGSGLAYTWPSDRHFMAIQIDQVLTRGMHAGTYRVLDDVGSDHFPIRADLSY